MGQADYKSVVADMRLESGLVFGLPIVFDTDDARVQPGKKVGITLITLTILPSEGFPCFKAPLTHVLTCTLTHTHFSSGAAHERRCKHRHL
jgi:hypothetical protein